MNRPNPGYDHTAVEDFEEMLPDRPGDETWQLIGGRVVAMAAGGRWEHHQIVGNLQLALANHFRRRGMPCRVFRETFWLREPALALQVLPDIMVHAGPLEPRQASISDPIVVIEVVSRGSAYRDRQEKRALYQKLPSVQEIALVALDAPAVELVRRGEADDWVLRTLEGIDAVLRLESIGFAAPLAELYLDVLPEAGAR